MRFRELLEACVNGESCNVSPVSAWQHKPNIDQTVTAFAEATLADFHTFDFDFVKLTPASTWQSIDCGITDSWQGDFLGRREILTRNIKHIADWKTLDARDPWQGFSGNILTTAKILQKQLPRNVPLLVTVFNPFFQATQQAGLVLLQQTALLKPALLREALSVLTENTIRLLQVLLDLNVAGIFFVTQHASSHQVSKAFYQEWALPSDLTCIDVIKEAPLSMLHLHGQDTYWQLYQNVPVVLHFDELGDSACQHCAVHLNKIAGTLPSSLAFMAASQQEISNIVMARRKRFSAQSYITTPGCALPLAVPKASIHSLVAAARMPLMYEE